MNKNEKAIWNTVNQYSRERQQEFDQLCNIYNSVTDMELRRKIRTRKAELVEILTKRISLFKMCLNSLGIKKEVVGEKKYNHLLKVQQKKLYLLNSLK